MLKKCGGPLPIWGLWGSPSRRGSEGCSGAAGGLSHQGVPWALSKRGEDMLQVPQLLPSAVNFLPTVWAKSRTSHPRRQAPASSQLWSSTTPGPPSPPMAQSLWVFHTPRYHLREKQRKWCKLEKLTHSKRLFTGITQVYQIGLKFSTTHTPH